MEAVMGSTGSAGATGTMANGGKSSLCNGPHFMKVKNKLTGLVVDNEIIGRITESALLHNHGVATTAVDNGFEAVDLFASGASFNLVVIDMHMPVMDGLEVTRRIRAMGIRTKIIGLAAFGFETERRAFMDAGADVFMEKPLSEEILVPILIELDHP